MDEIYSIFKDIPKEILDLHIEFMKSHKKVHIDEEKDSFFIGNKKIINEESLGLKPEIIKRRKAVYMLYGEKTVEEIAKELKIPISTVENDISFLKKKKIITIGVKKGKTKIRRTQIISLYGKLSVEQLAKKLNVSEATIKADIKHLTETNQLDNISSKKETEERRQIVLELFGKKYISEIASILGVSTFTVNQDIKWLRENGLINKKEEVTGKRTKEKSEEQENRRKQVAKLYGNKTASEIALILGTSKSTIQRDIKLLKKQGIILQTEKSDLEETKKRRREICRLYGKLTKEKIAKRLGISISTVNRDIDYLIRKGIIEENVKVSPKIEKRRQQVMKLFGKMNKNNIAKMLGVSVGTISNDIKFLREQGMIQGKTPILLSSERQESLDKRRKKVLELYGKKSIKEIADLLGVSETLVYRDIKFLLDEGKRLKKPVEEASINSNNNKENLEEKEYIAKINRKIIDLYEKGEIEQARKLLVLLRRKNTI